MKSSVHFDYKAFESDVLILGKGGSGKTFLVNNFFIPSLRKARIPFVVYDPRRSYGVPFEKPDVVYSIDEIPLSGSAIYRPPSRSDSDFNAFCGRIVEQYNVVVIIDEVHFFTSKHRIKSDNFREIVQGGRPRGISWICIARRPASIHNDIISDADLIIMFEQELPGDVEFMSKWIGMSAYLHLDPLQRDVINRKINLMLNNAPKLEPHNFVCKDAKGLIQVGKI